MALSRSDKEAIKEMIGNNSAPAAAPAAPAPKCKCKCVSTADMEKVVSNKTDAQIKALDDKVNALYTELQALKASSSTAE
jgi:hypothetical protein